MTVGWLRPKIILPAAWKGWDGPKLEAVLAHERMHIGRADWAIALLAAFNRCVFWFNPLAWWMEQKLASLAEEACDDAALLQTGAREPYAEALLDMAAAVRTGRGRMVWEAMAMARTVEVRKRIERILDETRQIPHGLTRGHWAALVTCSLPLMVVASVAKLAPAQDIRPAPQAGYARPAPAAEPEELPVALAQALPAPAGPVGAGMGGRGGQNLTPPSAARPGEIKYKDSRLLVLYFDLQGMTADEEIRVETNAQTFLSAQTTPADLVAIMSYAGQLKVLQDFTADRDLLSQTVRSLPESKGQAAAGSSGDDTEFNIFNSDRQLAALEAAVKMLGALPEKKALVYFGSGMTRNGISNDAQLRATIDAALRSNVAFYPVDARGQVAAPVGSGVGAAGAALQFQTEIAETVVRASAQAPYPYLLSMAATPVQKADPVYPAEALASGVQGDVPLEVVVGTDGHVRRAQVMVPRNPLLEAAAREAVSHYVYQPARAPNGELAEIDTNVTVPFRLPGVPGQEPTMDTIAEMRVLTQNYQAEYGRNAAGSGADHPARVLSKVDPEYPYALRAQGYQGNVTLEVTVGADGVPKDIRVVRPDPALSDAAVTAVRQWRFAPARKNGQPVESTVTLPISFRLE
jgi:VWFA-related protein/TonB family protein